MVCLCVSDECSRGKHETCFGGQSVPRGAFGGWKCTCSCHAKESADREMDNQLIAMGIDPRKLFKVSKKD